MKKILAVLLCLVLLFALSLNTIAAEFTPSAENKRAPEIVGIEDEDGNIQKFVFHDAETGEELTSEDSLDLKITSESEVDDRTIPEIEEMIEEAKEEISKAETVGDLPSQWGLKTQLEERIVNDENPAVRELELKDFVVSDLFDISLTKNGEEIEQVPPGQYVEFNLQTNFRPGDVVYVLVRCSDETGWTLVDWVEIDENGVMHIRTSSLCCLAFVVPGYGKLSDDDSGEGRTSPKTGHTDLNWLLVAGGVCIAAAVGVVLYKKKDRKN